MDQLLTSVFAPEQFPRQPGKGVLYSCKTWVFHSPWYRKRLVWQWQLSEEPEALPWYCITEIPIPTWDTRSLSSSKGKIRYGEVKWLALGCASLGHCQERKYRSAPLFLTAPSQGNLYQDLQGFPPTATALSSSKAGRPGGTTRGMPCIIHVPASSVECEGWDAGGSSAWLGERPAAQVAGWLGSTPQGTGDSTESWGTWQSSAVPFAFPAAGLAGGGQCQMPRSPPRSCASE